MIMAGEQHFDRIYRVIAEGDDAVGVALSIAEAIEVVKHAREHRKRHVAIVNDATGAMIDDFEARRLASRAAGTKRLPPR